MVRRSLASTQCLAWLNIHSLAGQNSEVLAIHLKSDEIGGVAGLARVQAFRQFPRSLATSAWLVLPGNKLANSETPTRTTIGLRNSAQASASSQCDAKLKVNEPIKLSVSMKIELSKIPKPIPVKILVATFLQKSSSTLEKASKGSAR